MSQLHNNVIVKSPRKFPKIDFSRTAHKNFNLKSSLSLSKLILKMTKGL